MSKKNNKYSFFASADGTDVGALRCKLKQNYINNIYNIWMNKYTWEGLDEDWARQQENFIMRKFWADGTVSCREMSDTEYLVFTPYAVMQYNLYDFPVSVNLINLRGAPQSMVPTGVQYVNKDVVLGWCQPNHKPILETVSVYVDKLVQVDMVLNTNLTLQKIPFLIGVNENDKRRMEDIVSRIMNDEVVIFADLDDLSKIQAVVTQVPFLVKDLTDYRNTVMNELLTILGVDNIGSFTKKERLIVDEVNSTNDLINAYGDAIHDEIQKFVDLINKTFGRSIKIKPNSAPVKATQLEKVGGNENETNN